MATVVAAGGFLGKSFKFEAEQHNCAQGVFLHGNMFHFVSRAKSCGTRHQSQDSCQQLKWKTGKWNCHTQQRLPLSFNYFTEFFFIFHLWKMLFSLNQFRNSQNKEKYCVAVCNPPPLPQQIGKFQKVLNKLKDFPYFWRDSLCKYYPVETSNKNKTKAQ